jgi:peptidyl-prolyl cis-trans isomerase SurA
MLPKYITRFASLPVIFFLCFTAAETTAGEVVDRIVAVVNNDMISLLEFEEALHPYSEKVRSLGYDSEEEKKTLAKVREDILNQIIDQKLTDQESRRAGITVNEKEIDAAVERVKSSNFYTDEELKHTLAAEGLTIEDYRSRMREQIVRSRLVNLEIKSKIVITKDDVKAYYKDHQEEFQGGKKYRLRNILMEIPSYADESQQLEIRKKMEDILAKIRKGQSFEKLAAQYSRSSSAAEGGDLGVFSSEVLAPELQEALKKMKSGQVTPVMKTDAGWQIFFVQEIMETGGKSLEDASPEIEEKLFNEVVNKKFRAWIEELRKCSYIKVIEN